MKAMRGLAVMLCAGAICGTASAQGFPNKPVRLITGGAGGANDLITRIAAQGITVNLGQPGIVINRGGVSSITDVMAAAADGYTLLAAGANQFWLGPFVREDSPYDPVRDFVGVTLTATSPNMIVVNSAVPANTLKELIALAKSRPGVLNYAIAGYGGTPHLAGELFKSMTQTNIVTVPYKSTGLSMTALMAGEVQVMFPTVTTGMPGVKGGKLKALAVTSDRPSTLAPGVPTAAQAGLPGYESNADYGVFVPAKTPANVIDVLNRAMVKYLQTPEVREKVLAAGLEIVASSPQEIAAAMKADRERMGKVIKEAGIKGE